MGKKIKEYFTLIEMLVVISIIAILAALLMPALQKAVDASRQVRCSNKEKMIFILTTYYYEDNQGYLPNPAWTWKGKIAAYDKSVYTSGNADRNLFYCPSAPEIPRNRYSGKNGSYSPTYRVSGQKDNVYKYKKLAQLRWIADAKPNPNDYYRPGDYNVHPIGFHSGLANALYWDGHVATIIGY